MYLTIKKQFSLIAACALCWISPAIASSNPLDSWPEVRTAIQQRIIEAGKDTTKLQQVSYAFATTLRAVTVQTGTVSAQAKDLLRQLKDPFVHDQSVLHPWAEKLSPYCHSITNNRLKTGLVSYAVAGLWYTCYHKRLQRLALLNKTMTKLHAEVKPSELGGTIKQISSQSPLAHEITQLATQDSTDINNSVLDMVFLPHVLLAKAYSGICRAIRNAVS